MEEINMGSWSSLVNDETKKLAQEAQKLHSQGISVAEIAKKMKKSESRIREYLKGANWNSKK
jgi:hypothetical protein